MPTAENAWSISFTDCVIKNSPKLMISWAYSFTESTRVESDDLWLSWKALSLSTNFLVNSHCAFIKTRCLRSKSLSEQESNPGLGYLNCNDDIPNSCIAAARICASTARRKNLFLPSFPTYCSDSYPNSLLAWVTFQRIKSTVSNKTQPHAIPSCQ